MLPNRDSSFVCQSEEAPRALAREGEPRPPLGLELGERLQRSSRARVRLEESRVGLGH